MHAQAVRFHPYGHVVRVGMSGRWYVDCTGGWKKFEESEARLFCGKGTKILCRAAADKTEVPFSLDPSSSEAGEESKSIGGEHAPSSSVTRESPLQGAGIEVCTRYVSVSWGTVVSPSGLSGKRDQQGYSLLPVLCPLLVLMA